MDPISLLIIGVALGVGGALGVPAIFGSRQDSGAAVAEAMATRDEEQARTDRQALEMEQKCPYDETACVAVEVCQMSAASKTEMVAPCDAAVNVWVSESQINACTGWEILGFDTHRACLDHYGARK